MAGPERQLAVYSRGRMIVVDQRGDLRVVGQSDHARLAAEVLSLWRADGLPDHARRDELLFAVREHDNGWRETDAAPHVDLETGRPHTFLDLPDRHRMELWDRGTSRFAADHPYSAVLITRHALALLENRRPLPEWVEFLSSIDQRFTGQLDAAGLERSEIEVDYQWLRLADDLSLRACGVLSETFEHPAARVERVAGEISVDPFPLAGATTFSIPCRLIADRRYESDTDLGVALASARWTKFLVRIRPVD